MAVPDPQPPAATPRPPARLAAWAGAALTVAMAAGLAAQLGRGGLAALARAAPADPLFYLAFAGSYLALPLGDWLIFRRLWGSGVGWGGFAACLRKRVVNEAVFGYAGEAWFLAWARSAGRAGVFAAVKDVAVLSALAGNAWTLALLAAALPLAGGLLPPGWAAAGAASGAAVALASAPLLLWRGRVLSLPAAALTPVFGIHLARQVAATLLLAAGWALGSGVSAGAGLWLALAAGRLVVQRLPFLPNKDLLFANLAVLLIGRGGAVAEPVTDLVAFSAALTLAVHLALAAALAPAALVPRRRHEVVERG